MKVKSESEIAQSCVTLRDPMDCSLPGSSIHGIFQARVLEWGASAFSDTHVIGAHIYVKLVFRSTVSGFSLHLAGSLFLPAAPALPLSLLGVSPWAPATCLLMSFQTSSLCHHFLLPGTLPLSSAPILLPGQPQLRHRILREVFPALTGS